MKTPKHIEGSEKVIEVLGHWPCFHDAEVISFSADRALPIRRGSTVARLAVHVREHKAIGEGTVDYKIVTTNSVLIRFLFNEACNFQITDFNHQNVIDSIEITQIETTDTAILQVEIESIWGFDATLRCSSVEIEAVEILPTDDV